MIVRIGNPDLLSLGGEQLGLIRSGSVSHLRYVLELLANILYADMTRRCSNAATHSIPGNHQEPGRRIGRRHIA